jgi:predicted RNase H-like HicB family nuclease
MRSNAGCHGSGSNVESPGRLACPAIFWYLRAVQNPKKHEFTVIVERDADGYYLASVPELRGCHTQARSLDKLIERVKEAIELCRDAQSDPSGTTEFIGVQRVAV